MLTLCFFFVHTILFMSPTKFPKNIFSFFCFFYFTFLWVFLNQIHQNHPKSNKWYCYKSFPLRSLTLKSIWIFLSNICIYKTIRKINKELDSIEPFITVLWSNKKKIIKSSSEKHRFLDISIRKIGFLLKMKKKLLFIWVEDGK